MDLAQTLEGMKSQLQCKSRLLAELGSIESQVSTHLADCLNAGTIEIGVETADLNSMLPDLQSKHRSDAEDLVREHRLKEALRKKQELEQKLSFISEAINVMSVQAPEPEDFSRNKEAKTSEKAGRKQAQELEEEKKKESAEFAKRHMEQQKALQKRREQQITQLATEMQKKLELDREMRVSLELKQQTEKEKRLQLLQDKALQRHEHLKQVQQILEQPKPSKRLEKPAVELPELEKRKTALAYKRPLTQEELKEHAQKYQEKLKQDEERRKKELAERKLTETVHQVMYSKNYLFLIEEEKKQKESAAKHAQEKLEAVEKQRRYAELVKEMYFPAIDKKKAEEMVVMKTAHTTTQKRMGRDLSTGANTSRFRQGENRPVGTAISEGEVANAFVRPPVPKFKHKAKPKVALQQTPEKQKPINYLEEQRKTQADRMRLALERFQLDKVTWEDDMHDTSLPDAEKYAKVRAKVTRLEEKARKNEALLSRMDITDASGLEAEAGVNDMIISSIKAKLALLQS